MGRALSLLAASLLLPVLALLFELLLRSEFHTSLWLPFLGAVLAAAYLHGLKGGLLSAAASVVLGFVFLAYPFNAGTLVTTTAFLLLSYCISLALEYLSRRTQEAAELARRESEDKYRQTFEVNVAVKLIIDRKTGRILDANGAALSFYGYSRDEMLQKSITDINVLGPAEIKAEMERAASEERLHFEFRHRLANGEIRDVEVYSGPVTIGGRECLHSIIFDVTGRRRAERALERSLRLESLGVLAGGIAHDFNNLLAGIYGHIEMARQQKDPEAASELLSRASSTIARAKRLTSQLITFSRGGEPDVHAQYLFPLAEETARFALAGSSLKLQVQVPGDLKPALFDSAQISQVIENLVLNAKQASPEGAQIEMTAQNYDVQEKSDLEPGSYVMLTIQDHGSGMTKDILAHAFDPFFTTRPSGTGLGLATAYSILKRHGGSIRAESEPQAGSRFHIILPAALRIEAGLEVPASLRAHQNKGPVLVMDDEQDVRDVLSLELQALGYAPYLTAEGTEAVRAFEARKEAPFTAVILDLTIPGGQGGFETARQIRALDPEVPIFLVSGYSRENLPGDFKASGITDLLQKPFRLEDLERLLRRA